MFTGKYLVSIRIKTMNIKKGMGWMQIKTYLIFLYFQILEGGAREALQDIISKVLLKTANQPEGKEEQIDDTLLV